MAELIKATLLIQNAAEVVTCLPRPGNPAGRLPGASVAIAGEQIVAVGAPADVAGHVDISSAEAIDAKGKVVAPGFVDSHTHLVFGGSRVREYAARVTRDMAEVKALGIPTGILATVEATRAETEESLVASAEERLRRMLAHGTTTVESKSGYALTTSGELKLLEVNRRLQALQPVDVVGTFLGAHAFPPEAQDQENRAGYVDLLVREMIPEVARRGLATFCDVFCEEGYFSFDQALRILEAGAAAGLRPKIHADEYSAMGAADLAEALHAVSADHLNYTSLAAAARLRDAQVVGVVMPALDFAVRHVHPFEGRALLDSGLTLALATDLCPGCWVESMQFVMQLACRLHQFSPEEALLSSTVNGARALGLDDRGFLAPGKLADLQIWDVTTFEDVIYRLGANLVKAVIKRGNLVFSKRPLEESER